MDIRKLSVEIEDDGTRLVTITAAFPRNEDLEADDTATLIQALDEINGAVGPRAAEEEADPPKPRRRAAAKTEEAVDPEEKPKRRRAAAADKAEATEEEKPEKTTRRRTASSTTTSPSEEAEPEAESEEKPKTRRRAAAKKEPEFDGPSKEDVAKAASEGVLALGEEIMTEIICEHSDTGKIDDIIPESRKPFIDAVNFELDAPAPE